MRHLEAQAHLTPSVETSEPSTTVEPVALPVAEPVIEAHEPAAPVVVAPVQTYSGPRERPPAEPAARDGAPDDFTLIEGVSHLQQSTLNALGIYHFEQIAAWTPANVAWVDQYLRLRGRITEQDWIGQASELAHDALAPA